MRLSMERLNQTRKQYHRFDSCECEGCRGHLIVKNTKPMPSEGVRQWLLGCSDCGWRPENNVQIVSLEFFPERGPRG